MQNDYPPCFCHSTESFTPNGGQTRVWRADKGLAGNSKDKRKHVIEKDGKSYLLIERTHAGASGKFSTFSVHVLNTETHQLDYVKAVDSWEEGKRNPCK